MIATFLKQLTKNVSGMPGWVPLVVFGYLCVYLHPALRELSREVQAVIVVVFCYTFYQLGDALDKAIFKPCEPKFVAKYRDDARQSLKIYDGNL